MLWNQWWNLACELRSACARTRTFLWISLCLAGMTVRKDLLCVTSIVRTLGLEPTFYDRLLDFLHSSPWSFTSSPAPRALRSSASTPASSCASTAGPSRRRRHQGCQGRTQDAGVKKLHRQSESNNKPACYSALHFRHPCLDILDLNRLSRTIYTLSATRILAEAGLLASMTFKRVETAPLVAC
jgi:hypothetical protein